VFQIMILFFLADNNFPYHTLQNTEPLMHNHKFFNDKLYSDSTHKIVFNELTKQQKLQLIVPFLCKELKNQ